MVALPTYEKGRGAASDCCVSTAKKGHVASYWMFTDPNTVQTHTSECRAVGYPRVCAVGKQVKVKVKQSYYRHGQALRVQISRQSAHEGGKVVSPMHRPPLSPRKYSWYSILLEAVLILGPAGRIVSKNSSNSTGNQTRDLMDCCAVHQSTEPPRGACSSRYINTTGSLPVQSTHSLNCPYKSHA